MCISHLPGHQNLDWFHAVDDMNWTAVTMGIQIAIPLLTSFPLGKFQGVGWLGHRVDPSADFWRMCRWPSIKVLLVYIPTISILGAASSSAFVTFEKFFGWLSF